MRAASTFSTRIALSFGALMCATMLVAVLLWYAGLPWLGVEGARAQRVAEVTRNLESLANQKLTTIRALISQRRGEALVLSESKILSRLLEQGDSSGLQKFLEQTFERRERAFPGVYQSLQVIDPVSGAVLAHSQRSQVGKPFENAALLQRAAQPGVTELLEEIAGGDEPTLTIVRQIMAVDDEGYPLHNLQGILVATLEVRGVVEAAISNERVGYEQPGVTLIRGAKGDPLVRFPVGQEKADAFWRSGRIARNFEGSLNLQAPDGTMILAVFRNVQLTDKSVI